jgi:RNA polymerase sigma factor (sigma-70 family)
MVRNSEQNNPLSAAEQRLVARVRATKVEFMDDPKFHRAGAAKRLFTDAEPIAPPSIAWYQPLLDERARRDGDSIARPPRTALLTAEQERVLFGQFNYARFKVAALKRADRRTTLSVVQLRELLGWHGRAEAIRDQIAESNLGLVLAMAKRVRAADLDFGDLVSEGNMALMRSIDKFDATRGFKFSTYACRAILKAYSRLGLKTLRHRKLFPVEFDPTMERGDAVADSRGLADRDALAEVKQVLDTNAASLTEIERVIVFHRFGLDRPLNEAPMTLAQVGQLVGVTKERVRQIQSRALAKMRMTIERPRQRTNSASLAN